MIKKSVFLISVFVSCSVFAGQSADISVTGKILPKPIHRIEYNEKTKSLQLINDDIKLRKNINVKNKKDIVYQDKKSSLTIYKKSVKSTSGIDRTILDFYY